MGGCVFFSWDISRSLLPKKQISDTSIRKCKKTGCWRLKRADVPERSGFFRENAAKAGCHWAKASCLKNNFPDYSPEIYHRTWTWWFPIAISYSIIQGGPPIFRFRVFVFGGCGACCAADMWQCHLIPEKICRFGSPWFGSLGWLPPPSMHTRELEGEECVQCLALLAS